MTESLNERSFKRAEKKMTNRFRQVKIAWGIKVLSFINPPYYS